MKNFNSLSFAKKQGCYASFCLFRLRVVSYFEKTLLAPALSMCSFERLRIHALIQQVLFFVAVFLLLIPGSSMAATTTVSGCTPNKDIDIFFNYTVPMAGATVSTNRETRVLAMATVQSVLIPAFSSATGTATLSNNAGTLSGFACRAKILPVESALTSLIMGGLCGLAFSLAVASKV